MKYNYNIFFILFVFTMSQLLESEIDKSKFLESKIEEYETKIYQLWNSLKILTIAYNDSIEEFENLSEIAFNVDNIVIHKFLNCLLSAKKQLIDKLTFMTFSFQDLISELTETQIKRYLQECINFINEECTPELPYDWRVNAPMIPKPIVWIACLMQDPNRATNSYGIKQFLNCERPPDFTQHPIRDHPHTKFYDFELNTQKVIEALGFIFNDIDSDWRRKDLRTDNEVYQDELKLYGSEIQQYKDEYDSKFKLIKSHLDNLGPEYIISKESHRIKSLKYKRMSNYIEQALSILQSNFDSGQLLKLNEYIKFIDDKSETSNEIFQKMISDENHWYESQVKISKV